VSCSDEDYNVITRGRLLDRMRVAVAGSLATKMVLGEDTNFNIADIKRVRRMAERFVFYYGAQPLPQRRPVGQVSKFGSHIHHNSYSECTAWHSGWSLIFRKDTAHNTVTQLQLQ
jgi:ATP-dependent Zn protease